MKKKPSNTCVQLSLISGISDYIKVEQRKTTEPVSKIHCILRVLVGGKSLNRFEAERFHDHCLHSTISALSNDYGIKIHRHYETVPCVRGRKQVPVKRYWLNKADPENVNAARNLMAYFERKAVGSSE